MMRPYRLPALALFLVLALLLAGAASAQANETDQFLIPDKPFHDLGYYFSRTHAKVLTKIVDRLNKKIDAALKGKNRIAREQGLRAARDPGQIADAVRGCYDPGFFEMIGLEDFLHSKEAKKRFPGRIVAYRPSPWIYDYTLLPIDPRKLVLLFKSSTIKVYGVYMGTDKWGHFHDLGHFYFKKYLGLRRSGKTEEEAVRLTVKEYSRGPISEGALIGRFATGVYSNADLATNYIGMKFYRNLTEPVMLKGQMHPPLLVRAADGEHWRLNDHVGLDKEFFEPFVSEHFGEGLNPCDYEWSMTGGIGKQLKKHAKTILNVYAGPNGQPRPKSWFDEKVAELRTYYGEDYGHGGDPEKMVSIGRYCFPEEEATQLTKGAAADGKTSQ